MYSDRIGHTLAQTLTLNKSHLDISFLPSLIPHVWYERKLKVMTEW